VSALLIDSEDARCIGVSLDNGRTLSAPATVLATGGAAALWSRTTNPPGATGSGLLLAHLAGAKLADLEMLQFHPTAVVAANGSDAFLVTEAVRGEGRCCSTAPATGSSTNWRPATRCPAPSRASSSRRAQARSISTCATSIRRSSRTS